MRVVNLAHPGQATPKYPHVFRNVTNTAITLGGLGQNQTTGVVDSDEPERRLFGLR